MERFPMELKQMIAGHLGKLDFASLKSLRLVSKSFASAAAVYLFEEVHFTLFDFSLEKLTNIACHNEYKAYVKSLTIFLIQIIDFDGYEDYVRWHGHQVEKGSKEPTMRRIWERHLDLQRQNFEWWLTPAAAKVSELISTLPNLNRLSLSDGRSLQLPIYQDIVDVLGFNVREPSDLAVYHNGLVRPFHVIFQALVQRDRVRRAQENAPHIRSITTISFNMDVDYFLEQQHLDNSNWGPAALDELLAREVTWEPMTVPSIRKVIFSSAFSGLKALDLCIHNNFGHDYDFDQYSFAMDDLGSLLAAAVDGIPALQRLKLSMLPEASDLFYWSDFPEFVDSHFLSHFKASGWEQLREFELETVAAASPLVKFLSLHANSLQVLRIRNSSLVSTEDSWISLVCMVAASLDLKEVHLCELYDVGMSEGCRDTQKAMEHVMLHKGKHLDSLRYFEDHSALCDYCKKKAGLYFPLCYDWGDVDFCLEDYGVDEIYYDDPQIRDFWQGRVFKSFLWPEVH